MLKKLNGKTTKLLLYIRNNFLSFFFKLSVFSIMLILLYLVCVLKQSQTASPKNYIDGQPIEFYQKLMLTTSTEIPSELDSTSPQPITEELTTTTENYFIGKPDGYFGTHPLFPIQEQTTAPIYLAATTTPSYDKRTTEETYVIPSPESEIPFTHSLSNDEFKMFETTTESLKKKTTVEPETTPTWETTSSLPETTEYVQLKREILHLQEEEQLKEQEEKLSTNLLTSTTSKESDETTSIKISSTLGPIPNTQSDDLFMDNWSNYLYDNPDHLQIHPPQETTSQLNDINDERPTENLFLNEDDIAATVEAPISTTSKEEFDFHEEEIIPQSADVNDTNKDSVEDKMLSLETPPTIPTNNLFNLFALDHLPSSSNTNVVRLAMPNNAPVPLPAANANNIHPIETFAEVNPNPNFFNRVNKFQELDTLLNRKLKDSMSFLERFFGNLIE